MKVAVIALALSLVAPVMVTAQEESADMVKEIRALVAILPEKRTKEQKQRIRDIWRADERVRKSLHGAAVLQKGDSVFDFPGLLQDKKIKFDAEKREYSMSDLYAVPSGDGGNDTWDVRVTFSEDGIVTETSRLKMNSR